MSAKSKIQCLELELKRLNKSKTVNLKYVCNFTPTREDFEELPRQTIIVDGLLYELPITVRTETKCRNSKDSVYKYTYHIKSFERSNYTALGDTRIVFSYKMDSSHWSGHKYGDKIQEGNLTWFKAIIKESKKVKNNE